MSHRQFAKISIGKQRASGVTRVEHRRPPVDLRSHACGPLRARKFPHARRHTIDTRIRYFIRSKRQITPSRRHAAPVPLTMYFQNIIITTLLTHVPNAQIHLKDLTLADYFLNGALFLHDICFQEFDTLYNYTT